MKPRVIPLALLKGDSLVFTSQNFEPWRSFGSLAQFLKLQISRGADELIVLDIDATRSCKPVSNRTLSLIRSLTNIPVSVGGFIRTPESATNCIRNGADKIVIGSLFFEDPGMVNDISKVIGAQSVTLKLDYSFSDVIGDFVLFDYRFGSTTAITLKEAISMLDSLEFGEIVLSSVDCDGNMEGIDFSVLDLIANINRPVILSGGAASDIDFIKGFRCQQLSGIAASTLFAYTKHTPLTIKASLDASGIPTRHLVRKWTNS